MCVCAVLFCECALCNLFDVCVHFCCVHDFFVVYAFVLCVQNILKINIFLLQQTTTQYCICFVMSCGDSIEKQLNESFYFNYLCFNNY